MILKNSFFKLMKEDLKRRIWTIALAMLVFFLSLPIICALSVENYTVYWEKERIITYLLDIMGPQYGMVNFITIVAAIICGLSSFYFLHSKKKVDLYHSIPVRRETLYIVNYINGLLIFIIPYVINVLLCYVVLQVNDYMTFEILKISVLAIGINLLFYCLIYTIVIIAVMLTGNFIISCFGTGVFLFYGPVLSALKELYFSQFYNTYYGNQLESSIMLFLSPIGIYIDTANRLESGMSSFLVGRILKVLIVTILLIGLGVFLYKKRPSEAAGKAMSFGISRPIIKFMLVVPISLYGGIIFKNISNRGSDGWFIFGLIFALVIGYGIIEIIYNFDIRSAFNLKKQLLCCAGTIAAIACIFQFDFLGYDTYIPKENKIESMSVAISELDNNLNYMDFGNDTYIGNYNYQLKYMNLTNFDAAYSMAELGVDGLNYSGAPYYNYYVKYTLKSGRDIYRSYRIKLDQSYDILKDIYDNPEFKEAHYPINQWDTENIKNIEYISSYNMLNNKEFSLDFSEKKQLIEIYKSELNQLTLDELSKEYPIATLAIQMLQGQRLEYYVYPSFSQTILFLKEHGFDVTKEIEVKDIKEIMVVNNRLISESKDIIYSDGWKTSTAQENTFKLSSYVDEAQMAAIYPYLVRYDYYWNNPQLINIENDIEVTVVIRKDDFGNEETYQFLFEEGMIPDFVKMDIQYNQ